MEHHERIRAMHTSRDIDALRNSLIRTNNKLARIAMIALGANVLSVVAILLAIWALV